MLLAASVFYGLGAGLAGTDDLMLNVVWADPPQRGKCYGSIICSMLAMSSGIIVLGSLAGSIGYAAMYRYVLLLMLCFLAFALLQKFFHSPERLADAKEN